MFFVNGEDGLLHAIGAGAADLAATSCFLLSSGFFSGLAADFVFTDLPCSITAAVLPVGAEAGADLSAAATGVASLPLSLASSALLFSILSSIVLGLVLA